MAREHTNRVVVYRIRPEIAIDDIDLTNSAYSLERSEDGLRLFVHKGKESRPQWAEFIAPLIETGYDELLNYSCSFVLLLKSDSRLYAIAGGHGYVELKKLIDEEFGLEVAVRLINERQVSALSQRSMKGSVRQVFRAVRGYDPAYDRENYNRILNHIEGKGEFEGRQFRISGRSSLVLSTVKDVSRIKEVIFEIEDVLTREPRIHLPKSYEEVRDPALIETLDGAMIAEFLNYWNGISNRDAFYLELRDPLIQFRCDSYKVVFRRKPRELADLDLDLVREALQDVDPPTSLEDLTAIHLTGISETGFSELRNEKLLDMLVFEHTIGTKSYIRFGKVWYHILDEIQKHIDEELGKVPVSRTLMPSWNTTLFPTEYTYNQHVAQAQGWRLLDTDTVPIHGLSKLELCDLYDEGTRTLLHVKKTWGSKSAYLFSQGITSAVMFRQSEEFRDKCKAKWPGLFDTQLPDATVAFCIAAPQAGSEKFPLNMSYFARLNLYSAVRELKSLDYKVLIAPITLTA